MPSVKKIGFLATSLLMGSLVVSAFGQAQPPGGAPDPNNPQGNRRGNFDPAQFRQRMMDRLKTDLGATDDEMAALGPKIQKVMDLERDSRGGRFRGGRGGPGGPGGQGGTATPPPVDPNASPVQKASAELRAVLENKDAKPDEIKAKLDTLRAARADAKTQLAAAQQELRLLTQRQEAVLVESGMLEEVASKLRGKDIEAALAPRLLPGRSCRMVDVVSSLIVHRDLPRRVF